MVDHGDSAAANRPVAMRPSAKAVVRILEIAKVVFVQQPHPCQHFALQVDAGKDHALHVPVLVVLIDVLFAAAGLPPPEVPERHIGAGMLERSIRMREPATHKANLRSAVGGGLQPG